MIHLRYLIGITSLLIGQLGKRSIMDGISFGGIINYSELIGIKQVRTSRIGMETS